MSYLYGIFIAHFLPGFFLLLHMRDINLIDPMLPLGIRMFIYIGLSFILGLIIDTFRYSITCLLSPKIKITFRGTTRDDIAVYKSIIDDYFRYHQFCANTGFAMIIASIRHFAMMPIIGVCYLVIAMYLLYVSSRIFKNSMERLIQKFSREND